MERKPTIPTYTGRTVDLTRPEEADVVVEDVAHGLSNLCRYCGQCGGFYSVGEHSLLVTQIGQLVFGETRPERLLAYLTHDASEAYLGEVTAALKSLLPDYRELEARWERAIRGKLGVAWDADLERDVGRADRLSRELEKRVLFNNLGELSPELSPHAEKLTVHRWPPLPVERVFLLEYGSLARVRAG